MEMDSITKEVSVELPGLIRVYKDGSVDRLWASDPVPPSPQDPETGVSSKDIFISTNPNLRIPARVFLPKITNNYPTQKFPILLHFHGSAFCVESTFSKNYHRYLNFLGSEAQVLIVSVEYRLAPEHPLPVAYEDCWAALQWLTAQGPAHEPWLANHGDLQTIFIGGDSAGANITHYVAMRAGAEGLGNGLKVEGAFISHPYFLEPKPEGERGKLEMAYKIWDFVYPNSPGGFDSPMINPMGPGAPSLAGLCCSRVLVLVAKKDELRDFGVRYFEAVKKSGFEGSVEFFEVKGEGHGFHIYNPDTENAKLMLHRLASFLRK